MFGQLLYHECLKRPLYQHNWLYFIVFMVIFLVFFAIALGGDAIAPTSAHALLWVALLLAAMLSSQDSCALEAQNGMMQQLARKSFGVEQFLIARLVGQWGATSLALIVAMPILEPLLSGAEVAMGRLVLGNLAMLCLCMMASHLAQINRLSKFLLPVIVLPLAIPVLILGVGTSAMMQQDNSMPLLAGITLVLLPCSILGGGAALRLMTR